MTGGKRSKPEQAHGTEHRSTVGSENFTKNSLRRAMFFGYYHRFDLHHFREHFPHY